MWTVTCFLFGKLDAWFFVLRLYLYIIYKLNHILKASKKKTIVVIYFILPPPKSTLNAHNSPTYEWLYPNLLFLLLLTSVSTKKVQAQSNEVKKGRHILFSISMTLWGLYLLILLETYRHLRDANGVGEGFVIKQLYHTDKIILSWNIYATIVLLLCRVTFVIANFIKSNCNDFLDEWWDTFAYFFMVSYSPTTHNLLPMQKRYKTLIRNLHKRCCRYFLNALP